MIPGKAYREYGFHYYRKDLKKGEKLVLPSPVETIGRTPTISIIPTGKIRTWNTSREVPVDCEGAPGPIMGGLMLPGEYTLEALEDSTYICFSKLPQKHSFVDVSMFDIIHRTLAPGASFTADPAKGDRLVFCLWGQVTVGGEALAEGTFRNVGTDPLVCEAAAPSEVAIYRLRGAS